MHISRRTMITASAAALGVSTIELTASESAHASGASFSSAPSPSITARDTRVVSTFSTDWTTQLDTQYPTYIELADASGAYPGFSAEFIVDSRLFQGAPEVVILQGSAIHVLTTSITELPDGTTSIAFQLPSGLGSKPEGLTAEFATPFAARNLYPSENIGTVAPVVLNLAFPESDYMSQTSWNTHPVLGTVVPWGVELSAGWLEVPVAGGSKSLIYRTPSAIRIENVGPGAIPAATSLRVDLDSRVVSAISVVSASIDGVQLASGQLTGTNSQSGDSVRLDVLLGMEVAPGSSLVFGFEHTLQSVAPTLQSVRFATAGFNSPKDTARPLRDTGKYSITDLSGSGNALMNSVATGNV